MDLDLGILRRRLYRAGSLQTALTLLATALLLVMPGADSASAATPPSGIQLVSQDSDGNPMGGSRPAISADGRYDDANRLVGLISPGGSTWSYAYDESGNRTEIVDAIGNSTPTAGDRTTAMSYDELNRLVGVDYSEAGTPDVTFGYDEVGNRITMTDGLGTETRSYDVLNRLTQIQRGTDELTYLYDDAGNVIRRSYPDGTQLDYTYGDDGLIAAVTRGSATTSYTYDAAGNLTATALPNGVTETRTYDRAGRLTKVRSADGSTTIAEHNYALDPVGNPTTVVTPQETTVYKYDALDRLKKACFGTSCGPGVEFIAYTYDPVGNRKTEKRPLSTLSHDYDTDDRLTAVVSEAAAGAEE